ncbi:antibiotic biosynthesis monooxygenase family protein [Paraglaciecola sp.]|uniref:putative quinol monooxygenase n=1 Tax=Paraglaciecola sp. TaxID=1920173 RepID=UPI003262EA94
MNSKLSCLVHIEVKEGRAQEQINLYNDIKPLVLAEPGCIKYELKRIKGSDTKFLLIEEWASQEALDAHDATPHMIDADSKSPSFRAKSAEVVEVVDV